MSTVRDSNITGLTGNVDVVCETFAILVKGYICVFSNLYLIFGKGFLYFPGRDWRSKQADSKEPKIKNS